LAVTISGCGSAPIGSASPIERPQISKAPRATQTQRAIRGGGYYLDDGPGDAPPADLDSIPEPVPQLEPLHRGAMRPYVVLGQTYTPMTELTPYRSRGLASWYGRRYHGKQTSIGDIYDMYAMTAAHPVLPLPSYVRVTNVMNGKSIIVRVNDRGPFIDNRLIDLSYTAAHRLDVLATGSALVEVETIIPDGTQSSTIAAAPRARTALSIPRTVVSSPPEAQAKTPASTATSQLLDNDPIAAIAAAAHDAYPFATALSGSHAQSAAVAGPLNTAPADARGIYLQLAAFGARDNAESYLTRTRTQVEWLAQLLHLVVREGMYRVQAGPYASSLEARQAADRIGIALGIKPLMVPFNRVPE
jgi:rare lipoprotein A